MVPQTGRLLLLVPLVLGAGCVGLGGEDAAEAVSQAAPDPVPLPGAGNDSAGEGAEAGADAPSYPACEHPWPCGDGSEWPANLSGPFAVDRIEEEEVESFDGTSLHGWIVHPDVPDGVEVPVVLGSTPYAGQTSPAPGDAGWGDYSARVYGINLTRVAEAGYAVAVFQVRGTGQSGGCFEMFGPREQRDQAVLVDDLGNRSWSNGRVGMIGRSYRGTTPLEAAIQNPDPLKTMVLAGVVSDLYTFYHTPQGAPLTVGPAFQTYYDGLVTGPPALGAGAGGPAPERATTQWLPVAPDRACPEVVDTMETLYTGAGTDDRDGDYWRDRYLAGGYRDVAAATLLTHGLHDNGGHAYQDTPVWDALPEETPKRGLEGHWDHEFPNQNSVHDGWALDDWGTQVLDWFAFWLKGRGDPPEGLGTVDVQDDQGDWHEAGAWPPEDADEAALHLAEDGLRPEPGDGARTFRSAPAPVGSDRADSALGPAGGEDPGPICPVGPNRQEDRRFVSYVSEPLEERVVVAGAPVAHLNVTATQPGGLVGVTLLDLGPDFRCTDEGVPQDASWMGLGRADLRFHDGGYDGEDFPTGTPTDLRVDVKDHATVVEAGHRVGVWLSYGDATRRVSQPYTPQITVGGDSEIVLPVIEGDLPGADPDGDLPPRPFVPRGDG